MTSPAEPGGIVSRAIILNAKLSVHARMLYAVLCCVVDDRREIERSKPELIDDSGLPRATLHRAMAELVEAGIVEVHYSINSDGGTRTNRYSLHEGGLTQRLPPVHTETPGVSEGDPLKESPAQNPVSEGDPGGSQAETGEGVSEGDWGSSLYKEGESTSRFPTGVTSHERSEHTMAIWPEPGPPAPEEARRMTMLDFNKIDIPGTSEKTQTPRKPRAAKPTADPDFDRAWDLYDYRADKVAAQRAWAKALKKAAPEEIIAAIPAYVAQAPKPGEPEGQGAAWRPRRKNFSTWLNKECWQDEIELPTPKGYQGRAGSDVKSLEGELDREKIRPICKLMRTGPMPGDLGWNRAWYYHWNVAEQRDWTEDQLLATGNTPEDVLWLMDAYLDGIDPDLYARMKQDANISEEAR